VIDTAPIIHAVLDDLGTQTPGVIASRFINTLGEIIVAISQEYQNYPVVLSGGVFQNKTLVDYVAGRFEQNGTRYLHLSYFPVNDGGIAAGQIYHAVNGFTFSKA